MFQTRIGECRQNIVKGNLKYYTYIWEICTLLVRPTKMLVVSSAFCFKDSIEWLVVIKVFYF